MGRSVSTHRHAIATQYLVPIFDEDEHDIYDAWHDFLDDIRNILTGESGVDSGMMINCHPFTGFDGYKEDDRWAGKEDHVILSGELSEISVSEYAGVVAVCLAPLDPDNDSHRAACHRAAPYFYAILQAAFGATALRKVGTFSNGESVYETVLQG